MAGALVVVSPWLAAGLLAAAGPALVAELRLSRRRAALTFSLSPAERRELFYADLLTDLSAAKEVRLFGAGPLLRHRMLAELRTVNAAAPRHGRAAARQPGRPCGAARRSWPAPRVAWALVAAAAGRLSAGDIGVVVAAVAERAGGAVRRRAAPRARPPRAAAVRPLPRAAGRPHPTRRRRPGGPGRLRDGIVLRDVWFRYGDDHPWVLRGVDLPSRPAARSPLVGRNGSGKSTLVKLLCRFYDPTRGAIRWDGVDLRELPVDELRAPDGAVFQDYMDYELTPRRTSPSATSTAARPGPTGPGSPPPGPASTTRCGTAPRVRHLLSPHLRRPTTARDGVAALRRAVAAPRAGPGPAPGPAGPADPGRAELRPGRRGGAPRSTDGRARTAPAAPASSSPTGSNTVRRRRPHPRPRRGSDRGVRHPRRAHGRLAADTPELFRLQARGYDLDPASSTFVVVAACLACPAVLAVLAFRRRWTVVRVRGGSMEPALHDGDLLLARRRRGYRPRRGDVVVLRRPPGAAVPPGAAAVHGGPVGPAPAGERWLIKRVTAVPGDPVPPGVPFPGPGRVPAGMVVVLGDRPGLDSRLFGPAPVGTIHATVVRTLNATGPATAPLVRLVPRRRR